MDEKPTINLYKKNGNKYNITEACDGIQWGGDYQQVARKLDLDVLYPVNDKTQTIVIPDTGDIVIMLADGSEIFRGIVWSRDLVENSQYIKITCYDSLIYLIKSTTSYNLKNALPEDVTVRVCNDYGVPIGSIASTGIRYNDAAMGKSPYNIIMSGYTTAKKSTGKTYMPRIANGKLNIIIKGSTVVPIRLDSDYNVQNMEHSENLDEMINKVIVYDDKGNITQTVCNQGWIDAYGIIENAIQYDKDKDNTALANKELKDMERKCSVDAFGDVRAITGNAIKVKSEHSKMVGLFFIDGDSHSWKNGAYTMNLTLDFQNLMDEQDTQEESKDSEEGDE